MKQLHTMLWATLLLVAAPFAAKADTASSTVDSWVGLESPFRVICTSVNFGVWFVPPGNRGGITTLSLDIATGTTDTVVTVSGTGSDRLAVIADRGYDSPLAGVCNVKGTLADNGASLTISFASDSNIDMELEPFMHIFATGLAAAPEGATLKVTLRTPETGRASVQVTGGEAVFRVVGDLTIPNNISRENYGAYKAIQPATIIVSDGV